MNHPPPPPDDVADLFRKFDGDPGAYREFGATPLQDDAAGTTPWALLQGRRATDEVAASAPAPVRLAPAFAPEPGPPPPAAVRPAMPRAAEAPAPPEVPSADPPRATPLAALFARLAAGPQAGADAAHSLLSHWRGGR